MKTWLVSRNGAMAFARRKAPDANCREVPRACNAMNLFSIPCVLEQPLHDMKDNCATTRSTEKGERR